MTAFRASGKSRKFLCHARRHMSGAVYKTYDAMLAMAKSAYAGTYEDGTPKPPRPEGEPLIFYASVTPTLVNHTGTSKKQLDNHIKQLLTDGWLHKSETEDGKRERNAQGHLAPVTYYILDHFEYCALYPKRECPPFLAEKPDVHREQPIRFQLAEAIKHPAGRAALVAARLAGQLPGATWDEIVKNLDQHPENMPKRLARKSAQSLARKSAQGRD
jgi:hypothetical protein